MLEHFKDQERQIQDQKIPLLDELLDEYHKETEEAALENKRESMLNFYSSLVRLLSDNGFSVNANCDFWATHRDRGLLLRREEFNNVIEALITKKPIEIKRPNKGREYANAAKDSDRGLALTSEGKAGVEIAAIFGFKPGQEMLVHKVLPSEHEIRDDKRFAAAKNVSGMVDAHDIKYVILRFSAKVFPEDLLEEWEKELLDDDKLHTVNRFVEKDIELKSGKEAAREKEAA